MNSYSVFDEECVIHAVSVLSVGLCVITCCAILIAFTLSPSLVALFEICLAYIQSVHCLHNRYIRMRLFFSDVIHCFVVI